MRLLVNKWLGMFLHVLLGILVLIALGKYFNLSPVLSKTLAWLQIINIAITFSAINYILWQEKIVKEYYAETSKIIPGLAILVAIFWGIALLFPHEPVTILDFVLGVLFMSIILTINTMFMQADSFSKTANKIGVCVGRLYLDKYKYGLEISYPCSLDDLERFEAQAKARAQNI